MTESCSVCGQRFDVQFRYQMEERDGGFAFFCSQECHGKAVRGEADRRRDVRRLPEALLRRARLPGRPRRAASCATRAPTSAARSSSRRPAARASARIAAPRARRRAAASRPAPTPRSPRRAAPPRSAPAPSPAARAPARAPMHAPARLAIFNHKGGTGKTTTSRQHRRRPRRARAARAPRRHRLAGQRRRVARREGREDALPRARHGRCAPSDAAVQRAPEPRPHRLERDPRRRRALPRRPPEPRPHPARAARARPSTTTTSSSSTARRRSRS